MRFTGLIVLGFFLAAGCAGKSKLTPGERKAEEVEALLFEAERELKALNIEEAKSILDEVRPKLRDPVFNESPESALLSERFSQDVSELELGAVLRQKRDLESASNTARQKLDKAMTELLKATEALSRKDIGEAQVSDVREALEEVTEELGENKTMEPKSPGYADEAKHARRLIERTAEPLALAKARVTFRKGPVGDLEEGRELLQKAQKESEPVRRKELSSEALTKFQSCAKAGRAQLTASPALATAVVLDQPKANTAVAAVAACDLGAEAAVKAATPGQAAAQAKVPAKPLKKPVKKKKKR
ncbi:MAG: hypothetical protein ACYC8T_31690 [Myxococcaceae bacterium]